MKVTCKCFGRYKSVNIRSSPFIRDDNLIGELTNHSSIEIEPCIYNGNWFKLRDQEAYVIMWLRNDIGLIDYVYNRAMVKTFSSKTITENAIDAMTNEVSNLKLDNAVDTSAARPPEQPKPELKRGRSKKERIPATVRNIVWVTHFQANKKGVCWLCKIEDISSANFECGHVISEKNGGKPTVDNLRPICGFCNKSVGAMNMEEFKQKYNI